MVGLSVRSEGRPKEETKTIATSLYRPDLQISDGVGVKLQDDTRDGLFLKSVCEHGPTETGREYRSTASRPLVTAFNVVKFPETRRFLRRRP